MRKVLHILQQPLQAEDGVFSGNDLRTRQLDQAIQGDGHHVQHASLRAPGQPAGKHSFRNRDELQGIILRLAPDVILVSYWELVSLLPFDLAMPVVLDYVAPRPLEELYEHPSNVQNMLQRLRSSLQRCDLILTGNQQQSDLLLHDLIEAGHDLRQQIPIAIVPLGAETRPAPQSQPGPGGIKLVMGGVSWPWRQDAGWLQALEEAAANLSVPLRVMRFEGPYKHHREKQADSSTSEFATGLVEASPLLPYREFSEFLTQRAHIGIELADWNVERAFSQSFRSLDFLRHGLPLICNDYLPLAALIRHYDAGWTVQKPQDLAAVMQEIATNPQVWQKKSAAALQLMHEKLSPEKSAASLLHWLETAQKSSRLKASAPQNAPVLGVPPFGQRLKRQISLIKQVATARLFGQKKGGEGVLFVTRGDLFPVDHGAAVRTVETARALGAQGVPVGIVTDDRKAWLEYAEGDFQRRLYPWWLRLVSLPSPLLKLLHYSKDLPQSNAFLYLPLTDGGFFWRILTVGKRIHAGTLQAEFPAYAKPCLAARAALDSPVVLVEHNVEYQRLRTQIPQLTDAQYENLRTIELDLCRRVDAVVCVSDADRQQLIHDGVPSGLLSTIPHGVNLDRYSAAAEHGLREKLGIGQNEVLMVYHGTFSYPPNRQAIRIFAEELLPRLEKLGLIAHVLAVGRDAPASSPHERIHFTGSVTDVAPWLKAADLAVVPLIEGGGTRMKIIDCFAARLPVISTSKGIEGIPIEPGKQALVIDDWQEMAEAIRDLDTNTVQRNALATAGHALAGQLDWKEIANRYRALYSGLG